MKKLATLTLLFFATAAFGQQADYSRLKADAERFYSEKSYSKAYELYKRAAEMKLAADEARWVSFRVADTQWRAESATTTPDSTKFDQAREKLEALVRDIKNTEDQDRVYAEVEESLGDFAWSRQNAQNWGAASPHYGKALEWWASQSDLQVARVRYLQLVFRAVAPPWMEIQYGGYYANNLPLGILDNAVKLAQGPLEESRAHYYLARQLTQMGDWPQRQRVPEELEAALKAGKSSEWYDDALYAYAEWMVSTGKITQSDTGEWSQEPDYVKAIELYRRITTEFKKGESKYYDQAKERIEELTRPVLGVYASNIFLPDSEIQLGLSWRNVKRIDLSLYKVELPRDVQMTSKDADSGGWISRIQLAGRTPFKTWVKETGDDGAHRPGNEGWRMDQRLSPGAYIVEVRGGGTSSRDIVLVTDASIVLKTSGKQALVYFCNAITGAPLSTAGVKFWERIYRNDGQQWIWRESTKTTDKDGLAHFELDKSDTNSREIFVSAQLGDRQAFSLGNSYDYATSQEPWRIYAFTDRPAYRPNETVQWKFVARQMESSVYKTPANRIIEYQIDDPKGNKVKEDKITLSTFGSAWGKLDLTEAMPLGAYQITFYEEGRGRTIGNAALFRLEEYKLPEYKVTVQTPEVDGRKKAFRLGDKVEATISAEYYYGGAVADASVEVLVYQKPFYHYWIPPHEFAWYYEDFQPQRYQYGGGNGQIIKRETLKTDAAGKVTLNFDTPRDASQDWEYFVEARVTDASRREIVGSDTVRVTRHRYYVYPRAEHNLYRPNDKVEIKFKTQDANDQPLPVVGQVKVTRDFYYEIWLDPNGREVKGDELRHVRDDLATRGLAFPPAADKQGKKWQLKFRGYQHDDVSSQTVKTDSSGNGVATFTPAREGYYRVSWSSPDKGAPIIQAETAVWITTSRITELGYRHGGVEIVVDKDTYHTGEQAPVMITSQEPDSYVLFSVDGDDLYSYQLLHLTGTSKLIDVPIEDKDVPNIFLNAAMVSNRQIFTDTKQVIVPPVEHFLNVDVKPDRNQYQPREEGTLSIKTTDSAGRPVAAEVALGLIDSSVFYIQQDTSGDPRQFYFGSKRVMRTQTQSTFQQKSYVRLVQGANEQLIEEEEYKREKETEKDSGIDKSEQLAESLKKPSGTLEGQLDDRARRDGPVDEVTRVSSKLKEKAAGRAGAYPESAPVTAANADASAQQSANIQVRNDFRSTAFWQPDVATDTNGIATVKVKYPDSLTSWTATARAITEGDKFGIATGNTRTKQPIIVRLESPRFFVVGDSTVVSAVINNNNDSSEEVLPGLEAEGLVVTGLVKNGQPVKGEQGPVTVPAGGEQRVDWTVRVQQAGAVKLKVTARGQSQADAMERDFIAYEHGIEKLVAKSGKLRGDQVTVNLDIPAKRKTETTNLNVQVAPSMAVTMLDALPYLIDYPYGCTEQTMSRFLPAAITAKTLRDLKLSPEDAMARVFGGIEPETAVQTHPKGKHDLKELERIEKESLDRLYGMQHEDGGWGWWKEDSTDHFMTAYALWGLTLARDAGVDVKQDVIDRAVSYLNDELVKEEDNYDMQAWMLHAVATYTASVAKRSGGDFAVTEYQAKAFNNLWEHREKLNAYTRALLALSAQGFEYKDKAQTLVRNLENGVKIDRTPDTSVVQRGAQQSLESVMATAHWGEDGIYYRWSDGGVEATSFALRAILAIDPQNKLVEPITNWLIKNRRGSQWSNTRDTAITVLALNDYLRVTGEAVPDMEYEVVVNGNSIMTKRLTAADAFTAPSLFHIDNKYVRDGANEIRIVRKGGSGPLYFSAQANFFSLEEPVKAAGNELFVRREYYKLVGHQTLLNGLVYERVPLRDGDTVISGERVDVVVTIEAKNNYEYLLFEDLKPAGIEAVQVRSGEPLSARELKLSAVERKFVAGDSPASSGNSPQAVLRNASFNTSESGARYTGRDSFVYQELRDRKVAMFIDKLPQGIWEIRYAFRAETPGTFHALPLTGQAMYVPEIRCNDDEQVIKVADKPKGH